MEYGIIYFESVNKLDSHHQGLGSVSFDASIQQHSYSHLIAMKFVMKIQKSKY